MTTDAREVDRLMLMAMDTNWLKVASREPCPQADKLRTELERLVADARIGRAAREEGTFAGWFTELRSAMSYRLWEQGGSQPEEGYVALFTKGASIQERTK